MVKNEMEKTELVLRVLDHWLSLIPIEQRKACRTEFADLLAELDKHE